MPPVILKYMEISKLEISKRYPKFKPLYCYKIINLYLLYLRATVFNFYTVHPTCTYIQPAKWTQISC